MAEQFQVAKPAFTHRKDTYAQEFSFQKYPAICLEITVKSTDNEKIIFFC